MADWEHAVRLAEASFGRLTTLVNNAGTLTAVTADDDTVQLTSQSITSVRAGIPELLSDCGRAANRICNRRLSGDGQETETLIFGGCTEEQTFHRDRAQGKRHLDPPDVLP
jgi:NAD(P)-dependent dehydrogenase (short-subunit alcohol dehydrogenase family)